MSERPDLDLVEEVRNGNRRAYTELMRRYQQRIYWAARRIVGRHEDADDIAQETFVKAFLALGEFRGDSGFYTWIYRIATNLALNALRKKQVMTYLDQSVLLRKILPSGERPDLQMEQRETEDRLQAAVSALPERQRLVFVMRFFDGMSYEEISEILRTSVGGLKANYFHAVNKVREYLKNEA